MDNKKAVFLLDFDNVIKNSIKLVKSLQKIGDVYIYSLGHPDYQKVKINKSGFEKIVGINNIIITQDKINGLKNILNKFNNDKVFIIDDRIEILEATKSYNHEIVTIWYKYGAYSKNKSILNNNINFIGNNIKEIQAYINNFINLISSLDNFSILKVNKILNKEIQQIIKYTKSDSLVKKFTHDSTRFKNKKSILTWFKKGKYMYKIINNRDKLLGIIWFSKTNEKPNFTFAIRIYKIARGLGLSQKFFNIAYDNFIKISKTKKLWLAVNTKNKVAIHLYKKLGFIEKYIEKNELIMILT